jgi:hypothetical protein
MSLANIFNQPQQAQTAPSHMPAHNPDEEAEKSYHSEDDSEYRPDDGSDHGSDHDHGSEHGSEHEAEPRKRRSNKHADADVDADADADADDVDVVAPASGPGLDRPVIKPSGPKMAEVTEDQFRQMLAELAKLKLEVAQLQSQASRPGPAPGVQVMPIAQPAPAHQPGGYPGPQTGYTYQAPVPRPEVRPTLELSDTEDVLPEVLRDKEWSQLGRIFQDIKAGTNGFHIFRKCQTAFQLDHVVWDDKKDPEGTKALKGEFDALLHRLRTLLHVPKFTRASVPSGSRPPSDYTVFQKVINLLKENTSHRLWSHFQVEEPEKLVKTDIDPGSGNVTRRQIDQIKISEIWMSKIRSTPAGASKKVHVTVFPQYNWLSQLKEQTPSIKNLTLDQVEAAYDSFRASDPVEAPEGGYILGHSMRGMGGMVSTGPGHV